MVTIKANHAEELEDRSPHATENCLDCTYTLKYEIAMLNQIEHHYNLV